MSMRSEDDNYYSDDNLDIVDHNFPLHRSKSAFFQNQKDFKLVSELSGRIQELERTVTELKWRIEEMEEDVGLRTRWGVKYSRRVAIIANFLLGLWNFWSRFLNLIQKRRRHIMQTLFVSPNSKLDHNLNEILYEVIRTASLRSSMFFLCSLLLCSRYPWKRMIGLLLSSFTSLWLSPKHTQLGNYLTLFANTLYSTASWSLNTRPKKEKSTLSKTSHLHGMAWVRAYISKTIEHF
eukprot:TRINITY_DN5722_c0_g1_i1.p1 TRINITY_DN5722_c0_g1~~TRINITY_DN5722_c0_g1_i1.p1  ORF type:complete len:236 (+),score=30.86 TRINITY_DN5722_c0_g1_i1:41-748(+)